MGLGDGGGLRGVLNKNWICGKCCGFRKLCNNRKRVTFLAICHPVRGGAQPMVSFVFSIFAFAKAACELEKKK